MKKTQAVLFDMDGVILDSEPLHTLARARFFAALGVPASAEKEIVLGARKLDYWTDFKSRYGLAGSPKELVAGEFREVLNLIKEKNLPESRNLSALLGFLGKNGVSVAVGSASSREYVSGVLEFLGIADCFRTIVCGDEVPRPKPAPDTYLIAAEKLGAEPGRCFVVEDSRTGSLAAAAAQIPCIGYRGTATAANSDFSACKYVVTDMREIIDIISSENA